MVGYPSLRNTTLNSTFNSSNTNYVMAYNGSWLTYYPTMAKNSLEKLTHGNGYFINAKTDFNLTV